jgi:hypothetical protein
MLQSGSPNEQVLTLSSTATGFDRPASPTNDRHKPTAIAHRVEILPPPLSASPGRNDGMGAQPIEQEWQPASAYPRFGRDWWLRRDEALVLAGVTMSGCGPGGSAERRLFAAEQCFFFAERSDRRVGLHGS